MLSRNKKNISVSSLVLSLFASKMGEFFLPHPVSVYLLTDPVFPILATKLAGFLICVKFEVLAVKRMNITAFL